MPRAVLMFRLPQESREHNCAVKGQDAVLALWDLDVELRNKAKHGDKDNELYAEIRQLLNDVMEKYGLNFDDLIE
jgi:hypothetical protein